MELKNVKKTEKPETGYIHECHHAAAGINGEAAGL